MTDIEPYVIYRAPDRAMLRLLHNTATLTRGRVTIWFIKGRAIVAADVYGFGSKMGGRTKDGEHFEDLEIDRIVAAMYIDFQEWRPLDTPCRRCGKELFQHHMTGEITDTFDGSYCLDPSAPGRGAGQKHSV